MTVDKMASWSAIPNIGGGFRFKSTIAVLFLMSPPVGVPFTGTALIILKMIEGKKSRILMFTAKENSSQNTLQVTPFEYLLSAKNRQVANRWEDKMRLIQNRSVFEY